MPHRLGDGGLDRSCVAQDVESQGISDGESHVISELWRDGVANLLELAAELPRPLHVAGERLDCRRFLQSKPPQAVRNRLSRLAAVPETAVVVNDPAGAATL